MTLTNRICVALSGICAGFVVLMAIDMTLFGGRFMAHAVHAKHPECSGTCHGSHDRQNAQTTAPVLALPAVQATHRPYATQDGTRRYGVLGMQVETGRRD